MVTAIDPTNPEHIEVVSYLYTPSRAVEWCSIDGGRTWQSRDLGGCYDGPSIAFDPAGDFFIALELPPISGQQISYGVEIIARMSGEDLSTLHYFPWTFDYQIDKPSIAVGVDPVHHEEALYLTPAQDLPFLTGWDVSTTPALSLTPYGMNSDQTMKVQHLGNASWGAPVIAPIGDVFVADGGGDSSRLIGGLWATNPEPTAIAWPSPTPPDALNGNGTLIQSPVPADPYRGIFNGAEIAMSGSGALFMAYVLEDPGFQSGMNSQAPFTHVYVVSCANPESSSPTWGTPVAVDSATDATEFLPALSVDPVTGAVGVLYYTTNGTSDSTYKTAVVQFACSTGNGAAGTWSSKLITPALQSNMSQNDITYTYEKVDYLEYIGLDMCGGAAQAAWADAITGSGQTQGVFAFASHIGVSDSSYAATITADAPDIYWRLNETSGTTAADTGGVGNSGAYAAGALLNQSGLLSHDDFARSIEGTVTSNFVYNTSTVSVEVQIMLSAINSSGMIAGFANGVGSGAYDKDLYIDSSGRVCWYISDGSPVTITGPVLNESQPYDLVGTFDGQAAHLYVNGADVGDAPASSTYTGYTVNDVMVGGGTAGFPNTLDFRAAELAVYGFALSPARVLAHYNAALAPYAGMVLADAPAAYWRLDEQSGTTAADSGDDAIDGAYTGSYTLGATGALQNSVDAAALFNGGMISGGGLGANNAGDPVTVECWVNSDWTGSNLVFAKGSNGDWAYGIQIVDGQLYILENSTGYASGAFIPTNQWSYVALVYNSGGPTDVYVNGILEAAPNYETTSDSSGDWLIGAGASPQLIDEVAVYKYPLSASEIRQHYLAGCPTYKQTVLYDSPTVYWRLDDPSGSTTAYDDSNTNTTGAYSGTYTQSHTGALPADADSATGFNGGSVVMNDNYVLQYPSATVEAWVSLNALPTGNALVAGFADGWGNYDKDLYVDSAGHINWMVNDGTQKTLTGPTLTVGQWYHVVGTVGGGSTSLYVDSQQEGTEAAGTSFTNYMTYDIHVAGGASAFGNINAAVDEFAVYNHALSWPQIAKHYTVAMSYYGAVVLGDSPVAYWRLSDTGGTALDSTGKGATGTYAAGVTETGAGAQFNGPSSGYVSGTGLGANGTGDTYTVEGWVDVEADNAGGNVFLKGSYTTGIAFGVALSQGDPGVESIVLRFGNAEAGVYDLQPGQAYIACVFSPSGIDVYVNGQHVYQSPSNWIMAADSTGDWLIGDSFTGTISDVAVYNYRLSSDQIMRHFMAGPNSVFVS